MMTGKLYFLLFVLLVWLVGYIDGQIDCSKQWKKRTFKKKCRKIGTIKGIKITEKNHRRSRYYSCKNQNSEHALNIPTSSEFNCCYNNNDGYYRWHNKDNNHLIADNSTLKCEVKDSMCPSPPPPGSHMTVREISRYMRPEIKDDVQYYEGDTLEYACEPGFEAVVKDYDYNYGDYYGDLKASASSQITCNSSNWGDINIEKCQEIVCDATYFKDIPNGNIPGYKESYKYGEYMELVCDDGYETRDDVYSVRCEHSNSFDTSNLFDFRCSAIQCPRPPTNLNAHPPYYTDRYINSTVTFICDNGYTLSGKGTWRCQENGRWDGNCVKCNADDTYCPAPCVPEGAVLLNPLPTYHLGVVINFTCSEDMPYAASVSRECLRNRLWSGDEINCFGGPVALSNLLTTLRNISENQIRTTDNETSKLEEVGSKTVNDGRHGGVDVFIMADVSGSITKKAFEQTKDFIKALLPTLTISDASDGTRLALYMFATTVKSVKFDHNHGDMTAADWESTIDELNMTTIQNETDKGTAFKTALNVINYELSTKGKDEEDGFRLRRIAQQVLIIISDGLNNHEGDIEGLASELKDKWRLEIMSVCIQLEKKARKTAGQTLMKDIASDPKNENFFYISEKGQTLDKIIETMIKISTCANCGCTHDGRVAFKKNNHLQDANKGAWPWMVQLRKEGGEHLCGASIIHPNWILTAAHCVENNQLKSLAINKWKREDTDENVEIRHEFDKLILHEKYDKSVEPAYIYDIALIHVSTEIEFTSQTHAVCLPNKTDEFYGQVFKDKPTQFGVVTGWGKGGANPLRFADTMKQMTMEIQSNETCINQMKEHNETTSYNSSLMFCAGGTIDDITLINTYKGDSGGPFSVYFEEEPLKDRFVQIGIVSNGLTGKEESTYGIYTRISPELRQWIEDKMNEMNDQI